MNSTIISLILFAVFSLCCCPYSQCQTKGIEPQLHGYTSLNWADSTLWYEGETRLKTADAASPDVFYLLPTCVQAWTDESGKQRFNADPSRDEHRRAWLLSAMLADTIFACNANLYLPYYRQATFGALDGPLSEKPIQIAENDAIEAFDYYLKHFNRGKRFILAGYSQGASLVKAILKHIDDNTYNRLIAAYVIGYGVTATDTMRLCGHSQSHIKLANDSASCGVTVNFNSVTYADAISPLLCSGNIGCINPVSWTTSSQPAVLLSAHSNPKADDTRFPYGTAVVPRSHQTEVSVSVDRQNHVLIVNGVNPDRYTFAPLLSLFPKGNLHLQELFFYGDYIRRNVLLRCAKANTDKKLNKNNNPTYKRRYNISTHQ